MGFLEVELMPGCIAAAESGGFTHIILGNSFFKDIQSRKGRKKKKKKVLQETVVKCRAKVPLKFRTATGTALYTQPAQYFTW